MDNSEKFKIIPADTIRSYNKESLIEILIGLGANVSGNVLEKIKKSEDLHKISAYNVMIGASSRVILSENQLLSIAETLQEKSNALLIEPILKSNLEKALFLVASRGALKRADQKELNKLGYLTGSQAAEAFKPYMAIATAMQSPELSSAFTRAFLSDTKRHVNLWDLKVVKSWVESRQKNKSEKKEAQAVYAAEVNAKKPLQDYYVSNGGKTTVSVTMLMDKDTRWRLEQMAKNDNVTVDAFFNRIVNNCYFIRNRK